MTTAADRQRVDIDPTTDLGQGAYRSVASRIQDQALANPEAIAIRWMGRDYDYRQLWEWASFVAGQVGPGQRVAVCATRGPAAVAAVVGILSAGAVLVPIDDSLPLRRRQVMLIESGATKVIAVGRFDLEMPGGSSDVLMLDESEPPDTKTD
jgi:acyl-CoA synthetase (AMP-forming)/AMP-acid ligase II